MTKNETQRATHQNRTWQEYTRFGGKRCNWFYSDGTRCRFSLGHTQKHSG